MYMYRYVYIEMNASWKYHLLNRTVHRVTVCHRHILLFILNILWWGTYLSIESHFVGVHGRYELHRKEEQIKCIALAVHLICSSFRCNSYRPWTPTKCDSILIFTSFYNKVCRDIAYFNTKMSYLSDFKRTKSKTLRTASAGRMTNWTNPPWEPVLIIRIKDWYL